MSVPIVTNRDAIDELTTVEDQEVEYTNKEAVQVDKPGKWL